MCEVRTEPEFPYGCCPVVPSQSLRRSGFRRKRRAQNSRLSLRGESVRSRRSPGTREEKVRVSSVTTPVLAGGWLLLSAMFIPNLGRSDLPIERGTNPFAVVCDLKHQQDREQSKPSGQTRKDQALFWCPVRLQPQDRVHASVDVAPFCSCTRPCGILNLRSAPGADCPAGSGWMMPKGHVFLPATLFSSGVATIRAQTF